MAGVHRAYQTAQVSYLYWRPHNKAAVELYLAAALCVLSYAEVSFAALLNLRQYGTSGPMAQQSHQLRAYSMVYHGNVVFCEDRRPGEAP
jgi:hypothetical protein